MSEAAALPARRPMTSWVAGLTASLSVLRAPILMAGLTILALWLPQQISEVYRILGQPRASVEPSAVHWQLILAVAFLFLLSIVFWQVARELAYRAARRQPLLNEQPVSRFILDWGPRVIAMAPFIAAALGIWYSWFPKTQRPDKDSLPAYLQEIIDKASDLQRMLEYGVLLALAAALAVFAAITVFERLVLHVSPATPSPSKAGRRFFLIGNWFLFPLIGALCIAAFTIYPIELPQYFGVIPIFVLWVIIVTVLAAAATLFSDVRGVPVIVIALLAVLLFETLDLTDNHRFRQLPGETARIDAGTAFKAWLSSRADAEAYRGKKPYPIYIVAAEGGGMYAAYHTAKVLTRLQDLCPNFAQHVFAISAVSGGGLGGSVFSTLAQEHGENASSEACRTAFEAPGPFEQKADQLLAHDVLSPQIWATLFPDFAQRFLPYPIAQFDRALGLEKSFEFAWDRTEGGENPYRKSFFDLCVPGAGACGKNGAVAPALLLNTTNVETGVQMVLSPMFFGYTGAPYSDTLPIEDFNRKSAALTNMPLSTAVGLSARFPWISPAGWYEFPVVSTLEGGTTKTEIRRMSFADGGYYEGSGVDTAQKLAEYIAYVAKQDKAALDGLDVQIYIIMITGSYKPVDQFFQTQPRRASLDEFTLPLDTLLQAWRARSAALPAEVEFERRAGRLTASSAEFDNYFLTLPLGWQLASISRTYLDLYTGRPQDCLLEERELDPDSAAGAIDAVRESNCLVRNVIDTLNPAPPVTPSPGSP